MASVVAEPKQIGDYVIEHELGRGAFGIVYKAHHRDRPDVPLALKVVQGRGNNDRMLLEPAVLSRLDHPNVVKLEDYFLHGGDLVLALEFINGSDLKTLLEQGESFSQADVREMLVQLGCALAAAHEQNVLHRDVKPANVLVVKQADGYRFVLTDFGIGQVRQGIQEQKQTGGTFLFMAPEQLRGRPSPQSDLWALGVIAYRMLAGRMPFPGPTLQLLTNQILYGAVKPPSEVTGQRIDPDLERVVLSLLDKSLQERTASADELLRELGHHRDSKRPARVTPVLSAQRSLDDKLRRAITWRRVGLVLCVLAYFLASKGLAGPVALLGIVLFYFAQRSQPRRIVFTVLAIALLAAGTGISYGIVPTSMNASSESKSEPQVEIPAANKPMNSKQEERSLQARSSPFAHIQPIGVGLMNLIVAVVGGSLFSRLRRLERERLLLDLAREEGQGSSRYLEALREALDSRFEDVGLHLKYAEALFGRGQFKEAAVECRILLRQDPYNFNGNLLLANAYLTLRLWQECIAVCDQYLEVSGYCFEFDELRQQALRRIAS